MKRKIKENIKLVLVAVITGIICITGTVLAENLINANQITYNTTTVADALDSMYQTMFSNNYSEKPKVVGKWIDGKPLYMQTITTTSPNGEYGTTKPVPSDIETFVRLEISMLNSNNDWNVFSATYGPINCYYHDGSDELNWEGLPAWGRNRTVYITFYYTKTESVVEE